MQPFIQHQGKAVWIGRSNIDTDQILPKQFMKRIERDGYESFLFFNWRYLDNGEEDPGFELNQPSGRGATILVTGDNFGCGSAREHAVWALHDYGIRTIISTSFYHIFYKNCFNSGLLPAVVTEDGMKRILAGYGRRALDLLVDLPAQQIELPGGEPVEFSIDPHRKQCLVEGKNEIDLTLEHQEQIRRFEAAQQQALPWLWPETQ